MDHFAIVEKLCRTALIFSADAPEVHRRVGQLKNALAAEAGRAGEVASGRGAAGRGRRRAARAGADDGREGEVSAQAAALECLLARTSAQRAPATGEAPTPETRARLRQDTVRHMLGRGTLRREHAQAAEEIRDVFEAVTAGLFPGARRLEVAEILSGTGRRGFRQPIERLPERLARLWRGRYKPWADAASAVPVVHSNVVNYTALQLTIAILVDGRSLAEIDRDYGLRRGTAASYFRGALHRYAVMAGWIRPRLGSVGDEEAGVAPSGAVNGAETTADKLSGNAPAIARRRPPRMSCGCGASFVARAAQGPLVCPRCGESGVKPAAGAGIG